ncbi:MAG: rhodanese-like domain-containing protein [Solirubrobacterales bacterium]
MADAEHDVQPPEAAAMHRAGEAQLVDVRTPAEYEAGRIAGITHIEVNELSARASELDPDRPVVFVCRSGGRSAMATTAFRRAGYDAHNMAGGMLAWVREGLQIEPATGQVIDH